nr:hypothetical protein GCM10020093_014290 [Planobispora longispora]
MLVTAVAMVNGAFVGLSVVFDYPQILQRPAAEALRRFTDSGGAVPALFALLAAGAALLAPAAAGTARLVGPGRIARAVTATGVLAALVQVAGLLRWPLLVPALARTVTDPHAAPDDVADAVETFQLLHTVLGQWVGEAAGYVFTSAFTVLLLLGLRRRARLPRVRTAIAVISVPLILAGLLAPFGVPGADLANFAGYILWSVWAAALGVTLLLGRPAADSPDLHEPLIRGA